MAGAAGSLTLFQPSASTRRSSGTRHPLTDVAVVGKESAGELQPPAIGAISSTATSSTSYPLDSDTSSGKPVDT